MHRVGYRQTPLHNINIHNTHLTPLLFVGSKSSSSKAEASMNIIDAAAGATVVTKARYDNNEITQSPVSRHRSSRAKFYPLYTPEGSAFWTIQGCSRTLWRGRR